MGQLTVSAVSEMFRKEGGDNLYFKTLKLSVFGVRSLPLFFGVFGLIEPIPPNLSMQVALA